MPPPACSVVVEEFGLQCRGYFNLSSGGPSISGAFVERLNTARFANSVLSHV